MENFTRQKLPKLPARDTRFNSMEDNSLDFLTIGVGCNCLTSLHAQGILDLFVKKRTLSPKDLESSPNPLVTKACLMTLSQCGIIKPVGSKFFLTDLGLKVSEQIGLVTIFFEGYGKLVSKQTKIATAQEAHNSEDLDGSSIANSSINISESSVDPILLDTVKQVLKGKTTICDLGCGCGTVLTKLCKETNSKGLGLEIEKSLLREDKNISIQYGDISKLENSWEDVTIVMQRHVFHDFATTEGAKILRTYKTNFPNMEYFIYVDFVAPDKIGQSIAPGFDYIHSLLGISPPTRKDTLDMFESAGYDVVEEKSQFDLPNNFLWLVKPRR